MLAAKEETIQNQRLAINSLQKLLDAQEKEWFVVLMKNAPACIEAFCEPSGNGYYVSNYKKVVR